MDLTKTSSIIGHWIIFDVHRENIPLIHVIWRFQVRSFGIIVIIIIVMIDVLLLLSMAQMIG